MGRGVPTSVGLKVPGRSPGRFGNVHNRHRRAVTMARKSKVDTNHHKITSAKLPASIWHTESSSSGITRSELKMPLPPFLNHLISSLCLWNLEEQVTASTLPRVQLCVVPVATNPDRTKSHVELLSAVAAAAKAWLTPTELIAPGRHLVAVAAQNAEIKEPLLQSNWLAPLCFMTPIP